MPVSLHDKLVVAISSRALFDFEEENQLFDSDPAAIWPAAQRLDVPAAPGVALLVRKLLAFNTEEQHVEVVLLSRNDPVSGMRVFRSPRPMGLPASSAACSPRGATLSAICGRWAPSCFCRPMPPM
jgi:5'-nucleotidase